MPEQQGPLVLGLSIPGSGEMQSVAGDLASKLAQFSGSAAGVDSALAEAVTRLVREVSAADGMRDITLEYRCEGGQAIVTARCGPNASEIRLALQG